MQLGSEGKGVIVNHIAREYGYHVRVGGPNAGHSFYYRGLVYKMQGIPCGWTNPRATLVIGAGAVISPKIILQELETIKHAGVDLRGRFFIDGGALVISGEDHAAEGGTAGLLHATIGSTGEGVGAARIRRIRRDAASTDFAREYKVLDQYLMEDTVHLLNAVRDAGHSILIEGTQGSGLSLIHGPWPYVTSADTNVQTLLADVGLTSPDVVIGVARTYPIRVAGNSGPLKNELTWAEMSKRLGRPVEEKTTVTKKVRRIGEWDGSLFRRGVMINRPTHIALTFIDYVSPADAGKTSYEDLTPNSKSFIKDVENLAGTEVAFVGTGGINAWNVIDCRK